MEIRIHYFSNEATVSGQAYYDLPIKEVGLLTQQTVFLPIENIHQTTPSLMIAATTQLLLLHCFNYTFSFTLAV